MVRTSRRRRRIEVYWENPPTACRALIRVVTNGHVQERHVGPRGRLTVEEVATVLRVPASVVRRAIGRGAIPVRRVHGDVVVTLQDALAWWEDEEDRFDEAAADAALREMQATGARPIPWATARRQL